MSAAAASIAGRIVGRAWSVEVDAWSAAANFMLGEKVGAGLPAMKIFPLLADTCACARLLFAIFAMWRLRG